MHKRQILGLPLSNFLNMRKLVFLFYIVMITSCCRFSNEENKDVRGIRIVSLSKHLTEMVFALGKGHNIVAVDLSSTYPDSAKL